MYHISALWGRATTAAFHTANSVALPSSGAVMASSSTWSAGPNLSRWAVASWSPRAPSTLVPPQIVARLRRSPASANVESSVVASRKDSTASDMRPARNASCPRR